MTSNSPTSDIPDAHTPVVQNATIDPRIPGFAAEDISLLLSGSQLPPQPVDTRRLCKKCTENGKETEVE
jgi:hypothetical protein